MIDYTKLYSTQLPLLFKNVLFFRTCFACPEQYDVWFNDKQIGYVRLRWGTLRAYYPDVGGETVFQQTIGTDSWDGMFETDEQRCTTLCKIAEILKEKYTLDCKTD